jgi:2-C-methyl-D-erythritol 4-phosphate cytidylyltransferase
MNNTIVIVLAGGSGSRFGLTKQFISIYNIPLFIHILKIFKTYPRILAIPTQFKNLVVHNIKTNNKNNDLKEVYVINGGNSRQESCKNALEYIKQNFKCKNVIITDANRPCITNETINRCLKALKKYKAVITVCKSINTSCISKDGKFLKEKLDRTHQFDLLMPQCFKFDEIYHAHNSVPYNYATDDSEIFTYSYPNENIKIIPISFWEGLKLTYYEDLKIFEILLEGK